MWMLLLVAYSQRDPNAYFLQKHISQSFTRDTSESMSLGNVFSWAYTALLRNLFGEYSGERCSLPDVPAPLFQYCLFFKVITYKFCSACFPFILKDVENVMPKIISVFRVTSFIHL